jgi:hypothetical protein
LTRVDSSEEGRDASFCCFVLVMSCWEIPHARTLATIRWGPWGNQEI